MQKKTSDLGWQHASLLRREVSSLHKKRNQPEATEDHQSLSQVCWGESLCG